MLLSIRSAGDVLNEDQGRERPPLRLPITTGSLRVLPTAAQQPQFPITLPITTDSIVVGLQAAMPGLPITTGSLAVAVTAERDASSILIPTGITVALIGDSTARLAITTGSLQVRANGAALPIRTGSIQVSLAQALSPVRISIPTGINVALATGDAFGFTRDLVIAAQADLATTLLDRPVLLGITFGPDQDFRSAANGGRIQQTNAEDVQFALISNGAVLNHNIVSHDPINGTIIFDLQLSSWTVTQDVPVRMSYGFVGQMTGTIAIGTRTLVQLTAGTAPPANIELPLITGLNPVGSTLTCSQGRWSGTFPQTYTYRWRRNGVDIPGGLADDPSYVTVTADIGTAVSCRVTASNIPFPAGVPALSSNSVTVTNTASAPVNNIPPRISGLAQRGSLLQCSQGEWTGTPTITYAYRWLRNGVNITGADAGDNDYTTVVADEGQIITCRVTASNPVVPAPGGVAQVSENSITVVAPGTSPFVRYDVVLEIDKPARADDIVRPTAFSTGSTNTYNVPADTIYDLRDRVGVQRAAGSFTAGNTGTMFRVSGAGNGSVITGGKVFTTNATVRDGLWHFVHGNETWCTESSGNFPGMRVNAGGVQCLVQGFYLKDCMDATVIDASSSNNSNVTYENIVTVNTIDESCQNDGQCNVTFRNCFFQGYVGHSWRPGAASGQPPPPRSGNIATFEYCLIHMNRRPFQREEDPDFGVAGSKRVGPYISPSQRNDTVVGGQGAGLAHKWFFKTSEAGGTFEGIPYLKMRVIMRNCILRIDTLPNEGLNNPGIMPVTGDGVGPGSVNGSSYENVTICWFGGPNAGTGTGHGAWPFRQDTATLAGMGITLLGGAATAASENEAFTVWSTAESEYRRVNGYRASDDTFYWNRVGG